MPSPLEQAGAIREPSEYACLAQDSQWTGEWTQRSPFRDAAVEWLIRKFYGGSRIDSGWDGLNREIASDLTDARRPGCAVYNSNTFPAIKSFYSYKYIQDGAETVRILLDGADGKIYDATNGGDAAIFTKSASAGPMRFLGVGTTLYMSDGIDQKKWLTPGSWQANTNVPPGTLINDSSIEGEPGHIQMALGGITLNIIAIASTGSTIVIYTDPQSVPQQFPNLQGATVTFSGLTGATYLNGNSYAIASIVSTTDGIFTITLAKTVAPQTSDTGSATTGNGTTGATSSGFFHTEFLIATDSGQQWKCYASSIENWTPQVPAKAPVLTPQNGTTYWQQNTLFPVFTAILDLNQNIEVAFNINYSASAAMSGSVYPTFGNGPTSNAQPPSSTIDNQISWSNYGKIGKWIASSTFSQLGFYVILDSNGNLQLLAGGAGSTGAAQPTWATTLGATTTDSGINWICLGPGIILTTASISYVFSTHAVDGSVSTASPPATIQGCILGKTQSALGTLGLYLQVAGKWTPGDGQIDQIWIFRTAQGQNTPVLEDQIPTDSLSGSFTYGELGIPDTSSNGQGSLDALIPAPIASANNPPPAGLTGMVYAFQRIWSFVGNLVYWSGGPDTVTGNGNTAWPPLHFIACTGAVVKLREVLVQGGGMIVYTTKGVRIILGAGTTTNPFYDTVYCNDVALANYNAEYPLGSMLYLMEANAKVSSLAIQYPFNPQSGYTEVGFPVGDQFLMNTTGGYSGEIYNPATAYLSWCVASTQDAGMYVADGAVGWRRMSAISPPESGLLWSPRAAILGGTSATQSVEISPGVFRLLIGPPAGGGPILMRDTTQTVWTDLPGGLATGYPSWVVKGSVTLCESGEVAEIEHVACKSLAVGSRPAVSLLLDEIWAGVTVGRRTTGWKTMTLFDKHQDPPNLEESLTVFSDRYQALQSGEGVLCENFQIKFDYGTQAVGDKLLKFSIYGAKRGERKQQ